MAAAARITTRLFLLIDIKPPSFGRGCSTVAPMYGGADESLLNASRRCLFPAFYFIPERVPGGGREALERELPRRRELFHGAKTAFELGVRKAQRFLRIHIEVSGPVCCGEQQVA